MRYLQTGQHQIDDAQQALAQNQPASQHDDGRIFPAAMDAPVPVHDAAHGPRQREGGHIVHAFFFAPSLRQLS